MTTRLLPIEQVLDRTGLSRRTLYTAISEGQFPRPVQVTKRRVGWPESEVEAFLTAKIAARDQAVAA